MLPAEALASMSGVGITKRPTASPGAMDLLANLRRMGEDIDQVLRIRPGQGEQA
jgi:hypothetical protein